MKKNLLFFIGLMLVMFSMVSLSRASVLGWGDNYIVQKDSQINSNLYVGGQQITLMGPVFGDVMGGGGNVFVNNTIQGDAMFLGGTVNVVSTINRNLRIAGATIVVSGKVGGDLAALGNNIRVIGGDNTYIGGDALLVGRTVVLSAPVYGSVKISGADVTIDSSVNGDVRIIADTLHIGPEAVIKGTLSYKSVRQADISPTAKIIGQTQYEKVEATGPGSNYFSALWDSLFWVKFISFFVSSMILFAVGKKSITSLSRRAQSNPWQNLFAGILFFIGAPISAVLLVITIIGLPLSVAVLGIVIIFAIVAAAFAPILLGTLIKKWFKRGDVASWKAILLGAFIFTLLGLVPFFGTFIRTVLFLISEGVMIRVALERLQRIRT